MQCRPFDEDDADSDNTGDNTADSDKSDDIADSDVYFQYHGGMIATVRALTGPAPTAYIGDNTRFDSVRTRTLIQRRQAGRRSHGEAPRGGSTGSCW